MHYSVLCFIKKPAEGEDIDAAVSAAMEPYGNGRKWDWYQIGGRWTGHFDGYDPEKDEANIETCSLCAGTGDRADLGPPKWKEECGGCNGCRGTGRHVTWPTEWKRRAGDVIAAESLTEKDAEVCAICSENYGWQESEFYRPYAKDTADKLVKLPMPSAETLRDMFAGHLVVILDTHN